MNSLRLLYCMLVLCLCFSLPSICAQKGSSGHSNNKSSKKATKKSQQNTMKRVAEAKAEARRATEAKQKEILRPYVPKSKLPVESESKQEKKKREFQKSCLRTMPKTFSLEQRTRFCQEVSTPEPIQCANDGRSGIKLSFDEIMELCVPSASLSSSSASSSPPVASSFPVECYKMVSNKDRKLYGMQLCRGAQNSLTWKCWRDITGIKGVTKHIEDSVALDFCTTIDDAGPVNCVRHALSAQFTSLSAPQIIDSCQYAVEVRPPHDEAAPLHCMHKLKAMISPSRGVSAEDIVQFCSASVSIQAADCFLRASHNASSATAGSSTLRGTLPSALLGLCWDARTANGPTDCLELANEYSDKSGIAEPGAPADWPLQLCGAAPNTGPAHCFAQTDFLRRERNSDGQKLSKQESIDIRMGLCYGASNGGPAVCLRRAIAAFYKVHTPPARLLSEMGGAIEVPEGRDPSLHYASLLCAGAQSDAPGDCAAQAPAWLASEEIVHLCSGPMPSHLSSEPVKCLEAVLHPRFSKRLADSPRRCLGYSLESLTSVQERYSRAQLLHMCSFHGSQAPLASAQCFRTVPSMLDHDTAVTKLCMNVTDTRLDDKRDEVNRQRAPGQEDWVVYDPAALSSCVQLVPADWSAEEKTLLCTHVNSSSHAEAVVKCAMAVHRHAKVLDKADTARVCREAGRVEDRLNEEDGMMAGTVHAKNSVGKRGPVAECVHQAFREVVSSGSSRVTPPVEVVIDVCSHLQAHNSGAGSCIAAFSTKSTADSITTQALTDLCRAPKSLEKLGCLKHARLHRPAKGSSRAAITQEEVATCLATPGGVHTVQVTSFESTADHPRQIMTGKSFSLEMQLYNQWGEKMEGKAGNGIRVMASINANNDQGAVMWGVRSNTSINGIVTLSSLVVSQPGTVDFKITTTIANNAAAAPSSSSEDEHADKQGPKVDREGNSVVKKTLSLSKLTVQENPRMKNSNVCLFVFHEAQCPAVTSAAETAQWENTFPNEVGILPLRQLMLALACADMYAAWAVQLFPLPAWSGYIQVQYRYGVDAVWTGKGLPSEEMSYYQRLGLPEGTSQSKLIRRAYHKKSLEWHPDRWSAMINSVASASASASASAGAGASKQSLNDDSGSGSGSKQTEKQKKQQKKAVSGTRSSSSSISSSGSSSSEALFSASLYTLAVQGAFELVVEAYKALMAMNSGGGGGQEEEGGEGKRRRSKSRKNK